MSGAPGRPERCPRTQPLVPDRTRSDRNLRSVVRLPVDLARLMTRDRVALSNVSKVGTYSALPFAGRRPVSLRAFAWRLMNSGGRAFPMRTASA